jgi:hypothetical protein
VIDEDREGVAVVHGHDLAAHIGGGGESGEKKGKEKSC